MKLFTSFSTKFLQGSIRHTPDAYLDELRDALEQRTGKLVSQPTIWRVLKASGFTMKKVSRSLSLFLALTACGLLDQ
jgi:Winged helix-turn helix